jgi:signal transduction histidine kinase
MATRSPVAERSQTAASSRKVGGRFGVPPRVDILAALVLVAAGQVVVWAGLIGPQPQHGSVAANAVLSAAWLSGIAWRRTSPVGALVWYTAVFCLLQPVYPHDLPEWTGFVPLVVLTANAGYRCDLRRAVGALLVSVAGLTVLTTAEAALRSWDTYIFNAAIVVPAWAAARTLARHNQRARQLASDLTTLAVEQAEREARAMAEERTRIARELHDVVAHSVTVLVIQVGSARMLIDNAPDRAQSQLLAAERSGREALGELRRLLSVLRPGQALPGADAPSVAPQPGLDDLPALVASFRNAGMRLSVDVDVDGATDDVSPGHGLTVYRIVQEGLTNALKHAPGAEVHVRVEVRPDAVHVAVVNGCSPAPSHPGSGYGLQGLRERVALYQGSYRAGPRGDGWEVRIDLPRAAADAPPARQHR